MIVSNNLRILATLAAVLLLLPADALEASTRKGEKYVKEARTAEAAQDYDKALEYYQLAVKEDPRDPAYQVGIRRVRFQASQAHVDAGLKLRREGKQEEALAEFQKAFNVDPGSAIALQEIRSTTDAIEAVRKGLVAPGEPAAGSVERARKDSLAMIQSLESVPELKPITNQIPLLKMNNQPPRVLYETVGKLAGVNVLFDPQIQPGKNANLDLSNVTLEEALNYIALLTKTYWKPVSANAIFVTEDNVTKRRDYEDQVLKVFYLKNPTSVQEFQEIITAIRSVTDVRRMFTFNAQNAVMVRDTVDKVAMVEKLLNDMDKPKAEVVVDIIVMEANSDRSRSLAAGLVSGSTTGLSLPIGYTPRNGVTTTSGTGTDTTITATPTTTTSSSITLSHIGKTSFSDFSTTLPGALLQAVMSDNTTRVMQTPEVRVSDGQKVSLKIGDKVPYATGSYQPGVGTVGVSPLVSTQFQFAETGVNVEITPHVHGSDELTMHISVDVSNVSRTVTIGGVDQPVIAQRKNEADIRVRSGEVSLLGGLMQSQDTDSTSGIPGLVNIPILGKYLFGSNSKDRSRGELLIAIIPHIVRAPEITGLDLRGVDTGADQSPRLKYAPRVETPAAPAIVPPAAPPAAASTTPTAAPATTTPAPLTPPSTAPKISFTPGTVQVQLSAPVVLTLQAENVTDLAAVPVKVKWDPKVLRLNSVNAAALFLGDGGVNPLTQDIRNDSGEATIEMARANGAAGVNGTGPVMQFTFAAVGKGSTAVVVTEMNLRDSKQKVISVAAPTAPVLVQ